MTEHGIERGERAQLIQAKRIFHELVQEDEDWQSHYNYANVLAALGEHEEARSEYLAALSLDEQAAPAWTNLGNTQFWLQEFDEALLCFDKALAIDPHLQEALASKGTALLQLQNKPEDAIPLIERAIGDSTSSVQWRQGWYWLGLAHFDMGQLENALECVNRGLELLPGQLGLLNLKASILSDLWRKDGQRIEQAIEYFVFLHELGPATYPATEELAQLYFSQGNADKAVKLLQANYDIPLEDLDTAIQAVGEYDLGSVLSAFKHIVVYARYRDGYPIEAYFEPIVKQGIRITDETIAHASIGASVMFGMAYEKLLRTDPSKRKTALEELYAPALEHFKHVILEIYKEIRSKLKSPTVEQLFELKLLVTKYATMEWTCQLGWIAGKLQMAAKDVWPTPLESARS
ncbi:tetratricopeptide repeat protein [Leptolyngbya sp. 15MV]|nr:tetratricopeptide repeat protein [Leptolyngbya sp. 15MV]